MPDIKLTARSGRTPGTSVARRLRHEGRIPGVVYGHGVESTAVDVDARSLRTALSGKAGLNAVLDLDLDGAHHLAMAKDIQRHPVRGTVSHVDFLVVNRDEVVTVDVPVALVGETKAVESAGGVIEHSLFNLTVHATPASIPASIEVDVSALEIGGSIRIGDLTLPAGVTTELDPETVVVAAQITRAEEAAEVAVEGEGGGAGEAADAGGAADGDPAPAG
jgi:large subunit ribosomal protein L25